MFDSLNGRIALICVSSIVLGLFCGSMRRRSLAITIALLGPIALSYFLAWLEMSPVLHPSAERQGGWDLIAAFDWSLWGIPSSVMGYIFGRWQKRR